MDLLDCPLLIAELVRHTRRCFDDMEVKVFTSSRQIGSSSLDQLMLDSQFWSNVLECYSVGHQQPVACLLPSSLERLQVRLSLAHYGAVQLTLDIDTDPREQLRQLEQHNCRLLFTDSLHAGLLLPLLGLSSALETVVIVDDLPLTTDYPAQLEVIPCRELRSELPRTYRWCPLDETNLMAVNGTNVPLSHRKAVLQALSAVQADAFNLSSEDRVLVLDRPSPDNPLLELSMCLLVGADLLIADPSGWNPEELVDIIVSEGVTKVIGADPLVNALDQVSRCQANHLFRLRELFFSDEHMIKLGQALLHHKLDVHFKHFWRNRNGALGGFVSGQPEHVRTQREMRARPLFSYSANAGNSEHNECPQQWLSFTGSSRFSH